MELYESSRWRSWCSWRNSADRAGGLLAPRVFDYEYAEIAAILGKSEAACRQAFSRAKKHLAEHRPRFTPAPENQRELLTSFLHAVQGGEWSR